MTERDEPAGDDVEAVLAAVRGRVTPDADERERLRAVADRVMADAREAIVDLPVEADVVQVGSTARGTWVAGDRDIDVFVRFPPDVAREDLERYGLQVGRAAVPDGREEFAEHPYIKGEVEGFDVDLVPCYRLERATDIRSAVDRTPFHNAYLAERIGPDLADDVRVAKAFLKGVGVYGSDLRTKGFSGYLTELLVLEYGGFRPLLDAARDWLPPVELDPEGHGTRVHDDPLVVVDPTDPARNVAAVCSAANVARLTHHARQFLAAPDESVFDQSPRNPLTPEAMAAELDRRGTTALAVVFDAPALVDDQLYPQLEKSLGGIVGELDRRGFDALRGTVLAAPEAERTRSLDSAAGDDGDDGDDGDVPIAALFVECAVAERPRVERHEGPPVHVDAHAAGFYETYAADESVYGPFVDGDRYVVEREREFTTPEVLLASDALFDVALGVRVESALRGGYDVLVGEETAVLADRFGADLAAYFDPRP
ncbi:CCA tRNA nucleotidyltransferase [Halomarina litorea]|uniref:CCA tRNA nucleotidyltransferase n=1 Tax=Halomarina litorea TaxID=2961595 RepID=UPI0020C1FBA3|nr:CCA tRNA nucleotidyltransferase [Halomarina sp. BCD28]